MKTIEALSNCVAALNGMDSKHCWYDRWHAKIKRIMDTAPSGAGIDCGTQLDMERSGQDKLVFGCSFHHMTEHGYYDGWTEHIITARPSFIHHVALTISGRNRNEIKDYLYDVYQCWLLEECPAWEIIEDVDGSCRIVPLG